MVMVYVPSGGQIGTAFSERAAVTHQLGVQPEEQGRVSKKDEAVMKVREH